MTAGQVLFFAPCPACRRLVTWSAASTVNERPVVYTWPYSACCPELSLPSTVPLTGWVG